MTPKIPVILYDTEGSMVPYIEVEKGGEMPKLLIIFEYRDTGETEPDKNGDEAAIVEQELHWYADMDALYRNLDPQTYDLVRGAVGLEPLEVSRKKAAERKAKADRTEAASTLEQQKGETVK